MNNWIILFITSIIVLSCFFDLKTRKIPNALSLLALIICIPLGFYSFGIQAAYSFFIIALSLLPFYLLGALGAGDYKLFCALSFALPYEMHFEVLVYTLIWASVYGLIKAASQYHWNDWFYQIYLDVKYAFKNTSDRFRIPFTIPYLLGWLSLLKLGGAI